MPKHQGSWEGWATPFSGTPFQELLKVGLMLFLLFSFLFGDYQLQY